MNNKLHRLAWMTWFLAVMAMAADAPEVDKQGVMDTMNKAREMAGKVKPRQEGNVENVPKKEEIRESMDRAREHAKNIKAPPLENIKATKPNIDIGKLAAKYDKNMQAKLKPDRELYVFVTLSMPTETLVRIARDTKRAGGKMVLRGFTENSMKETVKRLQPIQQAVGGAEINVDPRAYEFYGISKVPSYVLETGTGVAARIQGDVSLGYALEQIAKESRFAVATRQYLHALTETP